MLFVCCCLLLLLLFVVVVIVIVIIVVVLVVIVVMIVVLVLELLFPGALPLSSAGVGGYRRVHHLVSLQDFLRIFFLDLQDLLMHRIY